MIFGLSLRWICNGEWTERERTEREGGGGFEREGSTQNWERRREKTLRTYITPMPLLKPGGTRVRPSWTACYAARLTDWLAANADLLAGLWLNPVELSVGPVQPVLRREDSSWKRGWTKSSTSFHQWAQMIEKSIMATLVPFSTKDIGIYIWKYMFVRHNFTIISSNHIHKKLCVHVFKRCYENPTYLAHS